MKLNSGYKAMGLERSFSAYRVKLREPHQRHSGLNVFIHSDFFFISEWMRYTKTSKETWRDFSAGFVPSSSEEACDELWATAEQFFPWHKSDCM